MPSTSRLTNAIIALTMPMASGAGERRLDHDRQPSLAWVALEIAGIAWFMVFWLRNDGVVVEVAVLTFAAAHGLGAWRRTWRSVLTARLSLALGVGVLLTWLGMWATTRYLKDCGRAEEQAWVQRHGFDDGDRRQVPPVIAGFPLHAVAGGSWFSGDIGYVPDPLSGWIRAPQSVLIRVDRFDYIDTRFLPIDRGLPVLWANWLFLTLATWGVVRLVPLWMVVHLRLLALGGGVAGMLLGVRWFEHHAYV